VVAIPDGADGSRRRTLAPLMGEIRYGEGCACHRFSERRTLVVAWSRPLGGPTQAGF